MIGVRLLLPGELFKQANVTPALQSVNLMKLVFACSGTLSSCPCQRQCLPFVER